jgi:hypothetical protein
MNIGGGSVHFDRPYIFIGEATSPTNICRLYSSMTGLTDEYMVAVLTGYDLAGLDFISRAWSFKPPPCSALILSSHAPTTRRRPHRCWRSSSLPAAATCHAAVACPSHCLCSLTRHRHCRRLPASRPELKVNF